MSNIIQILSDGKANDEENEMAVIAHIYFMENYISVLCIVGLANNSQTTMYLVVSKLLSQIQCILNYFAYLGKHTQTHTPHILSQLVSF